MGFSRTSSAGSKSRMGFSQTEMAPVSNLAHAWPLTSSSSMPKSWTSPLSTSANTLPNTYNFYSTKWRIPLTKPTQLTMPLPARLLLIMLTRKLATPTSSSSMSTPRSRNSFRNLSRTPSQPSTFCRGSVSAWVQRTRQSKIPTTTFLWHSEDQLTDCSTQKSAFTNTLLTRKPGLGLRLCSKSNLPIK
jgi:hypothetical protein